MGRQSLLSQVDLLVGNESVAYLTSNGMQCQATQKIEPLALNVRVLWSPHHIF